MKCPNIRSLYIDRWVGQTDDSRLDKSTPAVLELFLHERLTTLHLEMFKNTETQWAMAPAHSS